MSRKNKIKCLSAIVLFLTVLSALAILSSGAAVKKVYLRNGGNGDGTSYENAIGDFKEAVRILAKNGGEIIICGKYTFTELINLSKINGTSNGTKVITVKSVDGENDYRQSDNAMLCFGDETTSANMILAGKFVFENLNIVTSGSNMPRAVVCNGYDTVFGEGIVCEKKGNAPFLSIVGISLEDDCVTSGGKITVKSGTYYNVCAGNRNGNSIGNTTLDIDGGTFEGIVSASGYNALGYKQEGNAVLVINGGTFLGQVGCITDVSNDFNFTINGGNFKKEISAYGKYNMLDINGGNLQNITAINIADFIEDVPETTENGETVETKKTGETTAENVKKSTVNINEYSGNVDNLIGKIKGIGVVINKNTMGGNDAETTAALVSDTISPETVIVSPSGSEKNETNVTSLEITEHQETDNLFEDENQREYLLGSRRNTVLAISVIGVVIALSIIIFAYRTVYRKK